MKSRESKLDQQIDHLNRIIVKRDREIKEKNARIAELQRRVGEVDERANKVANWIRKIKEEADEMFVTIWRRDDPFPKGEGSGDITEGSVLSLGNAPERDGEDGQDQA